jgi:peptidoglycan hydrolase CwlO-like protein
MKKLLILISIAFVACNTFPDPKEKLKIEEAQEAKRKSDSILTEFKRVNEQLQKTRDSLKQELDATYKSMDSTLKGQ